MTSYMGAATKPSLLVAASDDKFASEAAFQQAKTGRGSSRDIPRHL
jgi:hypothetical protein